MIAAVGIVLALSPLAMAQASAPSALLDQYRAARASWFSAVMTAARQLFGILALIEFAWSGAVLLLEKADLHSWTAGMVRKIMWIGAFYTLLIYGPTWIPAIIDSFEILGQRAAGSGPPSPSGILMSGISIAGALLKSAGHSGILGNFGTALVTPERDAPDRVRNRNCWPPAPTNSGAGTSPSCSGRSSGLTSISM